ncbi:MAG TPA: GerMN domain-containing protein [Thermoanaerobacterales bacterium]|nr:GerMN domain-containing protein [Thermoanaerobacterales bacterium]
MYLLRVVCVLIAILLIISGCSLFGNDVDPSNEGDINDDNGNIIDNIEVSGTKMRETIFYYSNDEGRIVPHVMSIPWEEGIAKAAIENLVDSDDLRDKLSHLGLNPVLPVGTKVLGLTIRDGLAKIDFNSNFLNYSNKKEEEDAVNSVICTLTEFPTIDMVQFMVEGKDIKHLLFDTDISGILDRECLK